MLSMLYMQQMGSFVLQSSTAGLKLGSRSHGGVDTHASQVSSCLRVYKHQIKSMELLTRAWTRKI